jgi:hypothetical protein
MMSKSSQLRFRRNPRMWPGAALAVFLIALSGLSAPPAHAAACSPETDTTTVAGATILQFKEVGACDWTVPAGVTAVEVLIVGGGGGGGGVAAGGGGGAGAVLHGTSIAVTPGSVVNVTVGAGGVAGVNPVSAASRGGSGGNSAFGDAVALGGGGGGGYNFPTNPPTWGLGLPGGSAGGHGELGVVSSATPSSQTSVPGFVAYGNAGGSQGFATQSGSGGGGAGAVGGSVTGFQTPGAGGAGLSFSITGTAVTYAGGGGGAGWNGVAGGAGGSGGGGAGAGVTSSAVAGSANSGGGGGGGDIGSFRDGPGAAGGSGIVIVRFPPSGGGDDDGADCDLEGVDTFSQGGWANTATWRSLTDSWFSTEFPSFLKIGGADNSVTLTTASNVRQFLPQSGEPAVLSGQGTNLTRKQLKNTLAGQATALALNIAWSPGLADAELAAESGYEGTVQDLLDDVNEALNGTDSPAKSTLSNLTRLAEYVNLSFPAGVDQNRLICPADN